MSRDRRIPDGPPAGPRPRAAGPGPIVGGTAIAVALVLAACAATSPPVDPAGTASPTPVPAAPSPGLSTASPGAGGPLPSPDLVAPAESCDPDAVCRRVPVARVTAIPITPPVDCGDRGECRLTLDLYYPADPPPDGSPYPVVAFAPGGPDLPVPHGSALALPLAGQGVVVADLSWRQTTGYGGGAAQGHADLACGILASRSFAELVGGDGDRVTLAGHSLGGWGGAVVATTPGGVAPDPEACDSTHGRPLPDAFVGLAGAYVQLHERPDDRGWQGYLGVARDVDPEAWLAADPIVLLERHGAPDLPILLLHGAIDGTVDIGETERFAEALREADGDAEVLILDGVDHGGILEDAATIRAIATFLGTVS